MLIIINYLAIAVAVIPLMRTSATGKGAVCGNLRTKMYVREWERIEREGSKK